MAGDLLLLASPLHMVEVAHHTIPQHMSTAHHLQVRHLAGTGTSHTFPTVDLVAAMEHSPVGNYLATMETRGATTYVRLPDSCHQHPRISSTRPHPGCICTGGAGRRRASR